MRPMDTNQDPMTSQAPTLADAMSYNAPIVKEAVSGAMTAAQDPQTWLDAAHQWGNAMIAGTSAPGSVLRPNISADSVAYHALGVSEIGPHGYSVEAPQGASSPQRVAVYRDQNGAVKGTSSFYLKSDSGTGVVPAVMEDRHGYPSEITTYVSPDSRRQGVATGLYNHLKDLGYAIDERSGSGALTPDGAAFAAARRSSR